MGIEQQRREIVDRRINGLQLNTIDLDDFAGLIQDNKLSNQISILSALSPNGLRIVEATSEDILKVATVGSGNESYDLITGTVSGAYTLSDVLSNSNGYTNFDILVDSNTANVRFTSNITNSPMGDIEVKEGMRFIDINSKKLEIKSKTSGTAINYQVVGYY